MGSYIKLSIASLMPVVTAALLYYLSKKVEHRKKSYIAKQIFYGIIFGILAIIGTEWGIPLNGAQVNCRDAAVLTAGLIFGGPAGIIAGFIGGIERWIAVAWGVGSFTRVACSVSTIIAGFYAALVRKYMFDHRIPNWMLAFAIGVVMEVFHLSMVFITNLDDVAKAQTVVKVCSVPMITANAVSVMLSAIVVALIAGRRIHKKEGKTQISQTIQRWMLVLVTCAFVVTTKFTYDLQDNLSDTQCKNQLSLAVQDMKTEIEEASDKNLLEITYNIAEELSSSTLSELATKYEVSEINLVGEDGIIYRSTRLQYLGFDMSSGEQSAEFLCLLDDTESYVQPYQNITFSENKYMKYAGVKLEEGFVQVGYNASRFQKKLEEEVVTAANNRHVGETGYIVIANKNKYVVSAPEDFSLKDLNEFYENADENKNLEDTVFSTEIGEESYRCLVVSTEGYYILAVMPEEEAVETRDIVIYANVFTEILVFAAMFGAIYQLIRMVIVNKMKIINDSLAKITGGNLDESVNVYSNEEFAALSDDINMTVSTLKRYIAEAEARIAKELETARTIQLSVLPTVSTVRKDFDIYATMNPAKEVGGDFYDFYFSDKDQLNILIADVSGKGIPAAMFMMRAKTELKTLTEQGNAVNEVFTDGNAALCDGNEAEMFVTAWQGSVDMKTGHMNFANAGHNPPLIKHKNGQFEYLKSKVGLVLAAMDISRYRPQELQLEPGDIMFLYTDGVTEATDSNDELYGEERLQNALNSQEFHDMKELCEYVRADVDAFVKDVPQFDDITMLAFRYMGGESR